MPSTEREAQTQTCERTEDDRALSELSVLCDSEVLALGATEPRRPTPSDLCRMSDLSAFVVLAYSCSRERTGVLHKYAWIAMCTGNESKECQFGFSTRTGRTRLCSATQHARDGTPHRRILLKVDLAVDLINIQ